MIELFDTLRQFFFEYTFFQYLVIFLGAAFGGEFSIISLAFLSAQNVFPIYLFLVIAFLGTLSSDILWFLLGKTKTAGKIIEHRYASPTISVIVEAINFVSRGYHLLAFIFAKFLIGTRIVVIFYVSKTNLSFKKFIQNDAIAIAIWLIVLNTIGFLSGLGFTYLARVLKNIYAGISFVILIILLFVVTQIWLKRFFTKEGEGIIKKNDL
jgi:membrane protein DedA with SNARE-associated domain